MSRRGRFDARIFHVPLGVRGCSSMVRASAFESRGFRSRHRSKERHSRIQRFPALTRIYQGGVFTVLWRFGLLKAGCVVPWRVPDGG